MQMLAFGLTDKPRAQHLKAVHAGINVPAEAVSLFGRI